MYKNHNFDVTDGKQTLGSFPTEAEAVKFLQAKEIQNPDGTWTGLAEAGFSRRKPKPTH
jgi:hypothetical protein